MDNLSTLIIDIRLANKAQKLTGAIFLDLVDVFDNVLPEALLIQLSKAGLPSKYLEFFKATISLRNLTGYAAGIALQRRQTTRGLPQSSRYSALYYLLYTSLKFTHVFRIPSRFLLTQTTS